MLSPGSYPLTSLIRCPPWLFSGNFVPQGCPRGQGERCDRAGATARCVCGAARGRTQRAAGGGHGRLRSPPRFCLDFSARAHAALGCASRRAGGGGCERCRRPDGRQFRSAARDVARPGGAGRTRWPDLDELRQRTTCVVLAAAHRDHEPTRSGQRNLRAKPWVWAPTAAAMVTTTSARMGRSRRDRRRASSHVLP